MCNGKKEWSNVGVNTRGPLVVGDHWAVGLKMALWNRGHG